MTDGRTLPTPDYAGDKGEADPVLVSALDAFELGRVNAVAVAGILAGARVLVPVVAVPVDDAAPGSSAGAPPAVRDGADPHRAGAGATTGDKHVEMAMVTVTGRDGRRGLPVFTSVAALQLWNPQARPVPVSASRAARAALDDGAEALLVDPLPRPRFVVQGEQLAGLADTNAPPPAAV